MSPDPSLLEPADLTWRLEEINANFVDYREGDHTAIVPGAVLTGEANEPGYVLYTVLLDRWQKPFQNELISGKKKAQILDRICFALISRGIVPELDS